MQYTVKSSEITRKAAADMETKGLLFMMDSITCKKDIHYLVVDFFNDLTGMDEQGVKLYDLQSKAGKSASPRQIGKELVTLYKNYISDINFDEYILFMERPSKTLCIDSDQVIFGTENIEAKALDKVFDGLKEECRAKSYIENDLILDMKIRIFLNHVRFVIDSQETYEYVLNVMKGHKNIGGSEEQLIEIFEEIKEKQAGKKNKSMVENTVITNQRQCLQYERHLTVGEIKVLIVQRIINRNPLEQGVPVAFIDLYTEIVIDNENILDDCQISLCKLLFDKNKSDFFWDLFDEMYLITTENPYLGINDLFEKLNKKKLKKCWHLSDISAKYLIATIKDGVS